MLRDVKGDPTIAVQPAYPPRPVSPRVTQLAALAKAYQTGGKEALRAKLEEVRANEAKASEPPNPDAA